MLPGEDDMTLIGCSCGSRAVVGDREIERFYGAHITQGHAVKVLCYECAMFVHNGGDPVPGCLNCEDYAEQEFAVPFKPSLLKKHNK
jgi:hypothetical protein